MVYNSTNVQAKGMGPHEDQSGFMEEVTAIWRLSTLSWKNKSVKIAVQIGVMGCRSHGMAEVAFVR